MSQLLSPLDVMRTSGPNSIDLSWTNPNTGNCTYKFRFVKKTDPGDVTYPSSTPLPQEKGGRMQVTLKTDPKEFKDRYAEVMILRADSEDSKWARETTWTAGATLSLDVAGRPFVFSNGNETDPNRYSGNLDFSNDPVELDVLAKSFLSNFAVKWPTNFPKLTLYHLSGFFQNSAPKQYHVDALTKLEIRNPFKLQSEAIILFEDLKLSVDIQEKARLMSLDGKVSYSSLKSSIDFGNVFIALGNGMYVFGLEIRQKVSFAEIIETLLGINKIDGDIRNLLPTFSPEEEGKAIQLYNASQDFTYDRITGGKISSYTYKNGFNLDQLAIEVLNTTFYVSLQVVDNEKTGGKKFILDAWVREIEVFGLATFKGPSAHPEKGVVLSVTSDPRKISLIGAMYIFPEGDNLEVDFDFGYAAGNFEGDLKFKDKKGKYWELGFLWSKESNFKITRYPVDLSMLEAAMDWAKNFKDIANGLKDTCSVQCKEIADFAFAETITTRFKFTYEVAKDTEEGWMGLNLGGTYTVSVLSHDIDITLNNFPLRIKIPKGFDEMGQAILDTLGENILNLAKFLWDNKLKLAELLALVTFAKGTKSAAEAACRFACQAGKEAVEKLARQAAAAAAEAAGAAAASALETAAGVVAALTGFLKLIDEIISWFDSKEDKKKKEKAKQDKANAEAKIRQLLHISNVAVVYKEGTGNTKYLDVTWNKITEDAGAGEISYIVNIGGYNSQEINVENPHFKVTKDHFYNGQLYNINVKAIYRKGGDVYSGDFSSGSITTPILSPPVLKVDFSPESKSKGTVEVNWQTVSIIPVTPEKMTTVKLTGYTAELRNKTKNISFESKTLKAQETACTFNFYDDTDPLKPPFNPDDENEFEIIVQGIADDPDLNSQTGHFLFKTKKGIDYMRIGSNFKIK